MRKLLRNLKSSLFSGNNLSLKREIATYLPENPIIIEAGAHIGVDTLEFNKIWPGATIHAFEPVPNIYKELQKTTRHLSNVITYPLALSSSTGRADIHVSSGDSDGSSSLLSPKDHLTEHPSVFFSRTIAIDTITPDDWQLEYNIERVDFLWLDMQGYELAALKAGTQLLKTTTAIYTEVFLKELYEGAPLYQEVRSWLEGHGFKVEKEEMDWDSVGNVLFVRKG
ncbi:MAG: FkbM family methyltransferase [Cyclobacteriaceae bacterium]|nr:FkbM family methyltransferase [Cyclobacteriaceae bacterium]